MELSKIREQSAKAAEQVCEAAKLKIGDLFVVGCSSRGQRRAAAQGRRFVRHDRVQAL